MNEYLITGMGAEHRRELLAEADANRLAREARSGRVTSWQRLTGRAGRWAAEHRRNRHALRPVAH